MPILLKGWLSCDGEVSSIMNNLKFSKNATTGSTSILHYTLETVSCKLFLVSLYHKIMFCSTCTCHSVWCLQYRVCSNFWTIDHCSR